MLCMHHLDTDKQTPYIKVIDCKQGSTDVSEMSLLEDANKQVDGDSAYVDFAQPTSRDNLLLFHAESQALALYDQLVELRLEKAVAEAQLETPSGT